MVDKRDITDLLTKVSKNKPLKGCPIPGLVGQAAEDMKAIMGGLEPEEVNVQAVIKHLDDLGSHIPERRLYRHFRRECDCG